MNIVQRIEAATPPDRDRYLDFLRVLAIAMVIFGHWMVRVITERDGELVAEDTVSGLRESTTDQTTLVVELDRLPDGATERVGALEGVSEVTTRGSVATVTCRDDAKTRVLRAFEESGATVEDFETEESSLEDLFIDYTTGATA